MKVEENHHRCSVFSKFCQKSFLVIILCVSTMHEFRRTNWCGAIQPGYGSWVRTRFWDWLLLFFWKLDHNTGGRKISWYNIALVELAAILPSTFWQIFSNAHWNFHEKLFSYCFRLVSSCLKEASRNWHHSNLEVLLVF